MEAFTTMLRRRAQNVRVLLRRAPPMVLLALCAVPVALSASVTVDALVTASRPVVTPIALPVVDTRPTWEEEVGVFSGRLADVFDLDDERADTFARWILEASARQDLPRDLVASLIYTESTFRTRVRSWSGAVGPAQVKPRFWSRFCGGVDLTDPEQNVYCGAQIVAHYMEQCGDFDCAVRLYNVGPRNLRDPYYRERSHVYLAKIADGRTRFTASQLTGFGPVGGSEDATAPAASAL